MVADHSNCEALGWVPDGVRRAAHLLFAAHPQLDAVIKRLLSDPRMEVVWHELMKRKRERYVSTADPFHPSGLPQAVESWQALAEAERRRAGEFRELGDEVSARLHEERAARM